MTVSFVFCGLEKREFLLEKNDTWIDMACETADEKLSNSWS